MRLQITLFIILSFFLLMSTSCKKELNDFSFSYTTESVGNYKQVVSFDSDKNYKIVVENYYQFNFTNKYEPIIIEGTLTDDEFAQVKSALGDVNFFGMDDSYGFDKEEDELFAGIMYTIYFKSEGKDKYISIRNTPANKLPSSYHNLVKSINDFVSDKMK